MKRTIITLLAVILAVGVAVAIMQSNDKLTPAERAKQAATPNAPESAPATVATPATAPESAPASPATPAPDAAAAPATQPADTAPVATPAPATPATPAPAPELQAPLGALNIIEAAYGSQPEPVLGSDDPAATNPDMMRVKLTSLGAGVQEISLAKYSTKPLEHIPYVVQKKYQVTTARDGSPVYAYPLQLQALIINGQTYPIDHRNWTVSEHDARHAVLQLTLADQAGKEVIRIVRTYRLAEGSYDLQLDQRVDNLSASPLDVRLVQLGQVDMSYEPSYMGDKRAVILGYFQPNYDRTRSTVFIKDFDLSRLNVLNDKDNAYAKLWPTPVVQQRTLELSFVALTNRYFTAAVHAPTQTLVTEDKATRIVGRPLDATFPLVNRLPAIADSDTLNLAIQLTSKPLVVAPGQAATVELNLYAGPKSPDVLAAGTSYSAVGLQHLVIYNLGGCCSFLTFGWLADYMLRFMKLLHYFLFDWGIAIIILVLVIRTLLHPITKRSQLNMMKFSRQMQTMAPELEKIKKKYADDKNKLNAETMKLYREKGVNPAAMAGGCLPMFLQMPIWYALYAMLFFAIELRHQPAFYNVFHKLGAMMGLNWSFLTDLSNSDHFILLGKLAFNIPLVNWHVDAINILPILMGVVFYFQQKYTTMTPTNATEMTEQQKTQMKMMKFMIFLFPVFLYKAPAGLNLYILASTAAGIVDSKIVRNHLKDLEARGELNKPAAKKQAKPGGFIDRLQKAAEAKRKEMEEAQRRAGKKGRTR